MKLNEILKNETEFGNLSNNASNVLNKVINTKFSNLEEVYSTIYELVSSKFNSDEAFIKYLENCEISINGVKKDLSEIQDYEENTKDFLCLEIYCSKTFQEYLKINGFDNNE